MAAPARLNNRDYENGQRIAALENEVKRLKRLDGLPEDVAAMKKDIEYVKGEISKVDQRFDKVDQKFDQRFDKVDESIKSLSDKLGTKVSETDKRLKKTEETLTRWKTILAVVAALGSVLTAIFPKWLVALIALL